MNKIKSMYDYAKYTKINSVWPMIPENILRIVRVGSASSIRAHIFEEWPLSLGSHIHHGVIF
jgi:hypothetical protein